MSSTVRLGEPRTEEPIEAPATAVATETISGYPVPQAEGPRSERERALAWIAAIPWEQFEPRGFYARWARPVLNLSFAILITPMACVACLIIGCVNLAIFRDPRKILFIQPRFGRRGRVFWMFKFRTMKETSSSPHDSWRLGEDHLRVTPFGRWLRNTHLDELPQLINILRGEMNVIGPRPEMIEIEIWAAEHVPEFARRLVLKPGITGPAQVTQGYTGCEISGYALKAAINERYRRELSLRVDLSIAVRTAVWMLSGRGWEWNSASRSAHAPTKSNEQVSGSGPNGRTLEEPLHRKDQETKVEATWNRYWEGVDGARLAAIYPRLAELAPWYHRPFICGPREELKTIAAALGELQGARTLEFGAGIGWTSLWLARAGAETLVADISSTALRLSREVFARSGCHGAWTQASIFEPTAELGGRDLVFNSGLIEHFHRPDQLRLLANMQTLARPGGYVIVFAPFAGGRLYQWAKRRMELHGTWRFGDEFPLHTMADLGAEVGLELVSETTSKPGHQLNFLAGVSRSLAWIGKLVYLATWADVTPLWRWCLGDSMLTTVFRRKP